MTTPTEALKIARDALADMIRAGKQAKVDLTTGIRDGEPVHPVSASLTFPLATAINAIAAIDALAQQASVPSAEPAAEWLDPRVQAAYEILCSDDTPPPEQHWEGWVARRIVDAIGTAPTAPAPQAMPVAPEPVKADGRLHADGYFTWARRDGYAMDKKLPCDFYLAAPAAPAAPAPTVQPLPARLVRFTLHDLKAERKRLDGFLSFGNEIKRAAKYDEWIAAIEAYCTAHGITAAPTKE